MNQFGIDLAQLLLVSGYAALLDRYKHRWEPEWTWVEVVVGNSLCLAAAALRTRTRRSRSWRGYEHDVARSFAIGGLPIIAWRVLRTVTMHRRGYELALQHLKAGDDDATTE